MEPGDDILMVHCPRCETRVPYDRRNPYRPFCSERCKQIDFGTWASERFRVPAQEPPDNEPSD